MENILVTGGAGYIGSHMAHLLLRNQYNVIVVDDLSNGYKEAIPKGCIFVNEDIGNDEVMRLVIEKFKIKSVIHFASFIRLDEGERNPDIYYENNVNKTIRLLEACVDSKIENFIFSSTSAIYGSPTLIPIDENHPKNPINVYGKTKLMVEEILKDFYATHGLNYGCLRYFNACGSDYQNGLGDRRFPGQHLIPIILQNISSRDSKEFNIFGNDYETKDGTCIRDYIHVIDLCDAHLRLLNYMKNGGKERYFNLGTGQGNTVLDIVNAVQDITEQEIEINYTKKRPGDPGVVIADASKAKEILGWQPTHSSIKEIIESAWTWEQILLTRS